MQLNCCYVHISKKGEKLIKEKKDKSLSSKRNWKWLISAFLNKKNHAIASSYKQA